MAKITINSLAEVDLETFLYEMNYLDSLSIFGGEKVDVLYPALNYSVNYLKYLVVIYSINAISSLSQSFTNFQPNTY